jgi:hypothetical protein
MQSGGERRSQRLGSGLARISHQDHGRKPGSVIISSPNPLNISGNGFYCSGKPLKKKQ